MKSGVFRKKWFSSIGDIIAASLLTIAAIVMVVYGLEQAKNSSTAEGRRILEDGLRRAVITCYAVEGKYPESLSYLEENYGVSIDRKRYSAFYEIEASNVFPEITVIEGGE